MLYLRLYLWQKVHSLHLPGSSAIIEQVKPSLNGSTEEVFLFGVV